MDPLSNIVTLLQPQATFSKVIRSAGSWRIKRDDIGTPFYCIVLDGCCNFKLNGSAMITLVAGDFILVPESLGFILSSINPLPVDEQYSTPTQIEPSLYSVGDQSQLMNAHLLVGHCVFAAPDSKILTSLLPKLVHIHEATRLTTLVELVIEESREQRPAKDLVLARLLEILLIEAFRSKIDTPGVHGLLVGLADERLAIAIRKIHQDVSKSWTVAELAKASALSRSAFFQRFNHAVGCTPLEYVITWKMAIAKSLIRKQSHTIADIAEKIGYKSASAFSTAFSKYTGQSPSKFD